MATTHRFHSRKPACQWDFLFLVYQITARTITKDWIEYIPKFHQTFLPILKVLASREQMHYRELVSQVISISFGDLPAESLKLKTKSGTNVLADRIGWGKRVKSFLWGASEFEVPSKEKCLRLIRAHYSTSFHLSC